MNAETHDDITRQLEMIKSTGLIADYWVSWVGCNGKLDPRVCSWIVSEREIQSTREKITSLLKGLVPAENVIVKIDNHQSAQ
jgi:hypothetical protein